MIRNYRGRVFYKTFAVLLPVAFIISALIFVTYIKTSFEDIRAQLVLKDSSFASFEASENLRHVISEKVNILVAAAATLSTSFGDDRARFLSGAHAIRESSPGFFSISWVDPSEVVRWVVSDEEVPAALNQKLRSDVKGYIEESRVTGQPQLSHVGNLYSGLRGFVVFVPIYTRDKLFKGWVAGTIVVEDFLHDFFSKRLKDDSLGVLMKWKNQDSYIFQLGEARPPDSYSLRFETKIYNQILDVAVSKDPATLIKKQKTHWNLIFISFYVAIAAIAIFLFYVIRTQFKVMKLYSDLRRDKAIISVLSHDIATPLTILIESAKRLKEKVGDKLQGEVDRILRSAEKQKDLLTKARAFHATNLGKTKIYIEPVDVSELITETLSLYSDRLSEKNISYKVDMKDGLLRVLADPMSAAHNVLGNVISNAIKFSRSGTKITLSTYRYKKSYVVIEVKDQGSGIPKEIINSLFDYSSHSTRTGTHGETGTGLGMLQIKAFMEYYKGAVEVSSDENGTTIRLIFRDADQV